LLCIPANKVPIEFSRGYYIQKYFSVEIALTLAIDFLYNYSVP
jgi:hypothetical protein